MVSKKYIIHDLIYKLSIQQNIKTNPSAEEFVLWDTLFLWRKQCIHRYLNDKKVGPQLIKWHKKMGEKKYKLHKEKFRILFDKQSFNHDLVIYEFLRGPAGRSLDNTND